MITQGVNSDGQYIRDVYVEHEPVDLICADDGMTRQEFKDECDINVLMATYERNGSLNHFNRMSPQYLDVTDVPDLPRAIAMMEAAETAFMTLPASVRREFDNSAVNFVAFAENPANLDRMRGWGLAPPAPTKPADAISEPSGSQSPPTGSNAA